MDVETNGGGTESRRTVGETSVGCSRSGRDLGVVSRCKTSVGEDRWVDDEF